MLTSEMIKAKARELGASVCGIGRVYDESDKQRDPRQILPNARAIIGFGFVVPKALFNTMHVFISSGPKERSAFLQDPLLHEA